MLESAIDADAEPLFERAAAALSPLPIETRGLHDNSAARALQHLAEQLRPLAVVVGSAHRGAIGRVLLGSVGRALLTGSPCPVAVAPRGYAGQAEGELRRFGVGLDGGPESERALDAAIGLAERLHGELTIITALSSPPVGYGTMPGAAVGDLEQVERAHTAHVLERAAERVPTAVPAAIERPTRSTGSCSAASQISSCARLGARCW